MGRKIKGYRPKVNKTTTKFMFTSCCNFIAVLIPLDENSRKRASNFLISFQEYKIAFLIVKFDLKK
jgi:hypothetical protein